MSQVMLVYKSITIDGDLFFRPPITQQWVGGTSAVKELVGTQMGCQLSLMIHQLSLKHFNPPSMNQLSTNYSSYDPSIIINCPSLLLFEPPLLLHIRAGRAIDIGRPSTATLGAFGEGTTSGGRGRLLVVGLKAATYHIYIYCTYIHACMHACLPTYLPTYIHTCLTKKGHQSSLSPNYVVPFSRNRQASPDASPEIGRAHV